MGMNSTKSRAERKPRKCALKEEVIAELAGIMTQRFFYYGEIEKLIKSYNYKCSVNSLLNYLEARGFLVASERKKSSLGYKIAYRVMTREIYIKIEEEHRRNVRKRLLETVSC